MHIWFQVISQQRLQLGSGPAGAPEQQPAAELTRANTVDESRTDLVRGWGFQYLEGPRQYRRRIGTRYVYSETDSGPEVVTIFVLNIDRGQVGE